MERDFWIDLIRVTGAFLVIAIHVSGRTAGGYAVSGVDAADLGLAGLISACFLKASGIAVPLFVMVSGALLLGRSETVLTFYRKRFGKILLPFVAWSAIFVLCLLIARRTFQDGTPITVISAIGAFLSGGISGHFWFMYMLISLYLVAPFLSVFIRNAPKSMLNYFLILWIIGIVLFPVINRIARETFGIAGISEDFRFELVSLWVGFLVAGYVFKDILIAKRWAFVLLVVWFFLSIAGPVNGYLLRNATPDSSLASLFIFMRDYILPIASHRVTLTLLAFLVLRSLSEIPSLSSSWIGRTVTFTAPLTFGIYLSHHLILTPTMEILELGSADSWVLVLIAIPVLTVFFYFATAVGIYLLRLNRHLRSLSP